VVRTNQHFPIIPPPYDTAAVSSLVCMAILK
jgi:hypothetical protein